MLTGFLSGLTREAGMEKGHQGNISGGGGRGSRSFTGRRPSGCHGKVNLYGFLLTQSGLTREIQKEKWDEGKKFTQPSSFSCCGNVSNNINQFSSRSDP